VYTVLCVHSAAAATVGSYYSGMCSYYWVSYKLVLTSSGCSTNSVAVSTSCGVNSSDSSSSSSSVLYPLCQLLGSEGLRGCIDVSTTVALQSV
jgi:hypothetical protein